MKIIGWLFVFFLLVFEGFSCTIFYGAKDGKVFAGSNEDWSDPESKMFFYPVLAQKHGWVKFGWGSGFPQGGMNDCGLFWDATSGPYLSMPVSELQKEKLPGPVMKKIIEYCGSLEEAKAILALNYCDDQYKAQYLIGDSMGQSVIVEGDSILNLEKDFQVLTNFYQSHPELGGYPCSRYQSASEMLSKASAYSPSLFGEVLATTHQEGKYPTQYSVIYDLKRCSFFLFHFHNFEEFIFVNLKNELSKGQREYDIADLFSSIKISQPANGISVNTTSVDIKWEGKSDSHYEVAYSVNADFSDSTTISVINNLPGNKSGTVFFACIPFLLLGLYSSKRNSRFYVFITLLFILQGCEKNDIQLDNNLVEEHSLTLNNLIPGKTYFWKIEAKTATQTDFESETISRYFMLSEN